MSNFEVLNPILGTPFEEPKLFWFIKESEKSHLRGGRRPSLVFRPSGNESETDQSRRFSSTSIERFAVLRESSCRYFSLPFLKA